jgi:hypothetical protein
VCARGSASPTSRSCSCPRHGVHGRGALASLQSLPQCWSSFVGRDDDRRWCDRCRGDRGGDVHVEPPIGQRRASVGVIDCEHCRLSRTMSAERWPVRCTARPSDALAATSMKGPAAVRWSIGCRTRGATSADTPGAPASTGGVRSRRSRPTAIRHGASCSLAIRGGSQTAGPRIRDSSPPNRADRWAGLSRARRRS